MQQYFSCNPLRCISFSFLRVEGRRCRDPAAKASILRFWPLRYYRCCIDVGSESSGAYCRRCDSQESLKASGELI